MLCSAPSLSLRTGFVNCDLVFVSQTLIFGEYVQFSRTRLTGPWKNAPLEYPRIALVKSAGRRLTFPEFPQNRELDSSPRQERQGYFIGEHLHFEPFEVFSLFLRNESSIGPETLPESAFGILLLNTRKRKSFKLF